MASRAVPSPINLLAIDPLKRSTIRGFEKITWQSVESVENFIPMLYNSKAFDPKSITYPVYAGISDAVAWDGIQPVNPQGIAYLYDVTAEAFLYANSVEYTFEMDMWDLFNMRPHLAKELGKSASSKEQTLGAAFWNNAFATTAWYDGVYFFSATHPLYPGSSDVQSNLISGALSHDTLKSAITALRTMVDPLGRPMGQKPSRLFVDDTKGEEARYILNEMQALESGTSDNNQNPFKKYGISVVEYPYFSTATQWMLQAATHKAYHNPQMPIKMLKPKETDGHGVKQDIAFANAFWVEEYYGFVGSTGL